MVPEGKEILIQIYSSAYHSTHSTSLTAHYHPVKTVISSLQILTLPTLNGLTTGSVFCHLTKYTVSQKKHPCSLFIITLANVDRFQ